MPLFRRDPDLRLFVPNFPCISRPFFSFFFPLFYAMIACMACQTFPCPFFFFYFIPYSITTYHIILHSYFVVSCNHHTR
ncbi:hypothetical protein BKA57DRAFT_57913 [Linnemannia elongata]|nr:hypothetical protein BKA57DRAFT_57913 [Linnemannia elongata]